MGYNFQLPVITALTPDQQTVLNEPNAIAVTGGPGTGKSVIGLWRHIRNYDTGTRKSLLVTYTKSLERFLKETCRSINAKAAEHVNRTYHWTNHPVSGYDEIIVDEAQDVELSRYDILNNYCNNVSYTTDDNQILYPQQCSYKEDLQRKFNNREFTLYSNFRNTKEISRFVRSVFPDQIRDDGFRSGQKPQLINIGYDTDLQFEAIVGIINSYPEATHNIVVLAPFQNSVTDLFNGLRNRGVNCSMYVNEQQVLNAIERIHVTTFKSCKGLEFDTVIIPNIHSYNFWNNHESDLVNDEDFYVVFTRSKNNIFLLNNSHPYYEDENLEFLETAINHGTVDVEDFVSNGGNSTPPPQRTNNNYAPNIEEEDDLPF
jgi:superfamily I DNA/RNA helicase